jgi:hypothetical protein
MYDMSGDSRGSQQQRSCGPQVRARPGRARPRRWLDDAHRERRLVAHGAGTDELLGRLRRRGLDARRDPIGWERAGFDDARWAAAVAVAGPGGALHGLTHAGPPLRLHETRAPVRVTTPAPGVQLVDLGQNAPYVPRLTVAGAPGTTIRAWPARS